MKKILLITSISISANIFAQNTPKTGIGTQNPTHRLHVKDTADPIRIEGLQPGTSGDQL